MATTKRYDESFKQTIIDLYDNGPSVTDLQKEFGVSPTTVYKWIDKYSKNSGQEYSKEDIIALKKENARLKEDTEILKKVLSIFATKK